MTRAGVIFGSCGACERCRQRRLASWTTRQELEAQAHAWRCSLATLTFAPGSLPEGRCELRSTLRLFFVRLRRAIGYRVLPDDAASAGSTPAREAGFSFGRFRYFAAVEHGSKGGRVHVHVNLFGLSPSDRIGGATLAELIDQAWPAGLVDVRPLRPGGAGYAAKGLAYVGKAISSPELEVPSLEFRSVSNGGGRSRLGGLGSLALPALAAEYSGCVPDDVSTVVPLAGGRRGFLTPRLADRLRRLVGLSSERIAALRLARLGELVSSSRERRWSELSASIPAECRDARYASFCQYWRNWRS